MDIEKLIHCLQCCSKVDAHNIGCDDCGLEYCGPECQQLCGTAATALSTLQAANEKLRNEVERQRRSADDRKHLYENAERAYMKVVAELEQVKRERDAAIADIAAILAEVEEIRRGYGVDNADADNAFADLCGNYCAKCGNNCYEEAEDYRCKNFMWRGIKEDCP